jgi:hypothetical protein
MSDEYMKLFLENTHTGYAEVEFLVWKILVPEADLGIHRYGSILLTISPQLLLNNGALLTRRRTH